MDGRLRPCRRRPAARGAGGSLGRPQVEDHSHACTPSTVASTPWMDTLRTMSGPSACAPPAPVTRHWPSIGHGTSWTVFPTPNFPGNQYNNLIDVVSFGPDDAWALGQTFSSQRSSFTEHWDGHRWTFVPLPNSRDLIDAIGGSGPGDLWAVGSSTSGTVTYHWDGVHWADVACPDPPGQSRKSARHRGPGPGRRLGRRGVPTTRPDRDARPNTGMGRSGPSSTARVRGCTSTGCPPSTATHRTTCGLSAPRPWTTTTHRRFCTCIGTGHPGPRCVPSSRPGRLTRDDRGLAGIRAGPGGRGADRTRLGLSGARHAEARNRRLASSGASSWNHEAPQLCGLRQIARGYVHVRNSADSSSIGAASAGFRRCNRRFRRRLQRRPDEGRRPGGQPL